MIYLIIINILAFLLCYIDKKKAIQHKIRIPEKILLFISIIGGCFGFALSMHINHHKTHKLKFKLIYIFCLVWIYYLIRIY